jgi:Protein of unknown function (DUF4199)
MENKISIKDLGIKWGLILGLVLIIYSLVLQMMGLETHQGLGMVSYLFIAGGFFLAFKEFKEENEGYMEFGEGFKIGGISTLIFAIFSSVFLYVYLKLIDDSMLQKILDKQYDEMEAKGMAEEQIDQAMEITSKFITHEWIPVFGFIGTVFMAGILCMIMAAIFKKKRPEFE